MKEGIPFGQLGHKKEGPTPHETYIEDMGLKGMSAELEEVFQSSSQQETLKEPRFAEAKQMVSTFREITTKKDGHLPSVLEAIRDLRIIVKEQGWNEFWDWNVIRAEAAKMGYDVEEPKDREDIQKAA